MPSLQSEVEAPQGAILFFGISQSRETFLPQLDLAQATRVVGICAPTRVAGRYGFFITDGVIPIVPAFPGFAINTLFYAAVVGAILALPLSVFPIRRHVRARRGRCPKCGYDLAGLGGAPGGPPLRGGDGADPAAPCPECGATPRT